MPQMCSLNEESFGLLLQLKWTQTGCSSRVVSVQDVFSDFDGSLSTGLLKQVVRRRHRQLRGSWCTHWNFNMHCTQSSTNYLYYAHSVCELCSLSSSFASWCVPCRGSSLRWAQPLLWWARRQCSGTDGPFLSTTSRKKPPSAWRTPSTCWSAGNQSRVSENSRAGRTHPNWIHTARGKPSLFFCVAYLRDSPYTVSEHLYSCLEETGLRCVSPSSLDRGLVSMFLFRVGCVRFLSFL